MPLNIPINGIQEPNTYSVVQDIIRRAIDGTTVPLFIDSRSNRITIGSTNGILNQFFVNVVSGFNANAIFYENIIGQKNACFGGDIVVSGQIATSTILCQRAILERTIYRDGTTQTTAASTTAGTALILISQKTASAASSISFTGLLAGFNYILIGNITASTATKDLMIRFNNDSAGNYKSNNWFWGQAGSGSAQQTTYIPVLRGSGANSDGAASEPVYFCLNWASAQSSSSIANLVGYGETQDRSDGNATSAVISGKYSGAAAITEIDILPSAGTITGLFTLYRMTNS